MEVYVRKPVLLFIVVRRKGIKRSTSKIYSFLLKYHICKRPTNTPFWKLYTLILTL